MSSPANWRFRGQGKDRFTSILGVRCSIGLAIQLLVLNFACILSNLSAMAVLNLAAQTSVSPDLENIHVSLVAISKFVKVRQPQDTMGRRIVTLASCCKNSQPRCRTANPLRSHRGTGLLITVQACSRQDITMRHCKQRARPTRVKFCPQTGQLIAAVNLAYSGANKI
ncbi:hypothetical protein BKA63DRAFT_20204 [Paraphoma chrysanthemicola]|nr:hypothetical protein BKA63DRAFT_20204 [Paraphoma chrysanthemicola]